MKNVTLSADADLIEKARPVARAQHKTLNGAFREWLQRYAAQLGSAQDVDALMKRLRHVRASRHFSRAEMNERNLIARVPRLLPRQETLRTREPDQRPLARGRYTL